MGESSFLNLKNKTLNHVLGSARLDLAFAQAKRFQLGFNIGEKGKTRLRKPHIFRVLTLVSLGLSSKLHISGT